MKKINFKSISVSRDEILNAASSNGYLIIGGVAKQHLGRELSLEVITEKKSIIVMDNKTYNETYVKDLIDECYKVCQEKANERQCNQCRECEDDKCRAAKQMVEMFEKTEFYYIDDPLLRLQIINPNQVDLAIEKDYSDKEIEKMVVPCMMSFDPERKEVGIQKETISPIVCEQVIDILGCLNR